MTYDEGEVTASAAHAVFQLAQLMLSYSI